MTGRAFVVTVSVAPRRVVVEDVRTGSRFVVASLDTVGGRIAQLLELPRVSLADVTPKTKLGAP